MSDVPVARPKIVRLCGSLRFAMEFATERTRLTLDLVIVLAPEAAEAPVRDPLLALSAHYSDRTDPDARPAP